MVRLLATPCIFSCQTFWTGMTTISILLKMDEGVNFIAWYLLFKMNTKTSITTFHTTYLPRRAEILAVKLRNNRRWNINFQGKKRQKRKGISKESTFKHISYFTNSVSKLESKSGHFSHHYRRHQLIIRKVCWITDTLLLDAWGCHWILLSTYHHLAPSNVQLISAGR